MLQLNICIAHVPASYRPGDRMRKHSKEEQKELWFNHGKNYTFGGRLDHRHLGNFSFSFNLARKGWSETPKTAWLSIIVGNSSTNWRTLVTEDANQYSNLSLLNWDQTQTLSLAKIEWKKPPFEVCLKLCIKTFEVCLKLCIKTVPAGAFSASIDLPARHWERTAVDMQIISLLVPPPSSPPLYTL